MKRLYGLLLSVTLLFGAVGAVKAFDLDDVQQLLRQGSSFSLSFSTSTVIKAGAWIVGLYCFKRAVSYFGKRMKPKPFTYSVAESTSTKVRVRIAIPEEFSASVSLILRKLCKEFDSVCSVSSSEDKFYELRSRYAKTHRYCDWEDRTIVVYEFSPMSLDTAMLFEKVLPDLEIVLASAQRDLHDFFGSLSTKAEVRSKRKRFLDTFDAGRLVQNLRFY